MHCFQPLDSRFQGQLKSPADWTPPGPCWAALHASSVPMGSCGKGCHWGDGWRPRLRGGPRGGPENGWIVWRKRSCCRSWPWRWSRGRRLVNCFGDFRHRKGGVELIWIQIWRCMECWREMEPSLWNMMDIGGIVRMNGFRLTSGRMQPCCHMPQQVHV